MKTKETEINDLEELRDIVEKMDEDQMLIVHLQVDENE